MVRKQSFLARAEGCVKAIHCPLFVFCMEVLGHSIEDSVSKKIWKPIRPARGGPGIAQLLFADDLILFGEGTEKQAGVMQEIMSQFCHISEIYQHKEEEDS